MPNSKKDKITAAPVAANSNDFAIVIMAAGKGTRLKSKRAKVLHEIAGQPLLAHVIKAAQKIVPAEDIYVIIGHQAENVRKAIAPMGVKFVLQAEQRGTGHAVMCARDQVAGYRRPPRLVERPTATATRCPVRYRE